MKCEGVERSIFSLLKEFTNKTMGIFFFFFFFEPDGESENRNDYSLIGTLWGRDFWIVFEGADGLMLKKY